MLVAACSGTPGIEGPRAKPVLRLVACSPAQPLFVEIDGRVTSHGRLDGDGMGWAGGPGRPTRKTASVSFGMPTTSGMMDAMLVRKTGRRGISESAAGFDESCRQPDNGARLVNWDSGHAGRAWRRRSELAAAQSRPIVLSSVQGDAVPSR